MGHTRNVPPVPLFCGVIAPDPSLLTAAAADLERAFGPIALRSEVFAFDFTDYYEAEMGPGLLRQFVCFARPIPPDSITDAKLSTNAIERQYMRDGRRSINLDPGYATPAQVVLPTTKPFAHRIYLRDGIHAEVTLNFTRGDGFKYFDWTYPDFRSGRYASFLLAIRKRALDLQAATG